MVLTIKQTNATLTVSATTTSPAVASLASMLRTLLNKADFVSGQGVFLLSLPQVKMVTETDKVTCHSLHTHLHKHTHWAGGGGRLGRDWNVVEEVLLFHWLIPRCHAHHRVPIFVMSGTFHTLLFFLHSSYICM